MRDDMVERYGRRGGSMGCAQRPPAVRRTTSRLRFKDVSYRARAGMV